MARAVQTRERGMEVTEACAKALATAKEIGLAADASE